MAAVKFTPKQRVKTYQDLHIPGKKPPFNATIVWCRTTHAGIRVRGHGEFVVNVGTLTTR